MNTQTRLLDTQQAFDSVAADYDGPRGNNIAIQDMRDEMWRWLDASFTPGSKLIDLGCGTGLDAVHLAERGHRVTATDWSERMVERTRDRARDAGLDVDVRAIGAHELQRLEGDAAFDGAYSNLGPLNCVPDLGNVAAECARLIKPGGRLVFTVIGRYCPWELAHYLRQRRWKRAGIRFARDTVAVGMNGRTIWTRYYTPAEFFAPFAEHFELEVQRGLCVFVPPPYLTWLAERHPRWHQRLWALDRRLAGWPLINRLGDHFLLVMRRRASS
jgi:ubiquinone/menaquinone biosynthesis C-methylase UbiE